MFFFIEIIVIKKIHPTENFLILFKKNADLSIEVNNCITPPLFENFN